LQVVPPMVPGEICIGGANVARGYLGAPGVTAASFVPDPLGGEPAGRLFRTGDRGRRRADGSLEILGRRDAQVKVRAHRVDLFEVETLLGSHPAVREAVLRTRRREGSGEVVIDAWVELADAASCSPDELRRWLLARLPEYAVPASVAVLRALPRAISGKVDRARLTAPAPDGPAAGSRPALTAM